MLCPASQPSEGRASGDRPAVSSPLRGCSVFLLQVKEYNENTYYSDFFSHLENIRSSGEGSQQRLQEGRGMSVRLGQGAGKGGAAGGAGG